MDYFSILNLKREPFSNSPDPEYFFLSRQHNTCLQKLELSLRLRRGLNVVIGDVGTGKTTLCRQLIRRFAGDEDVETHLILDPCFNNPLEFLSTVAEMFKQVKVKPGAPGANDRQIKEIIKKYIFRKGVDEKKTIILIIDEGQKIPVFCLEILREFLNYETNQYKLLQIVIFAQKEFAETLKDHANFADRINLYHTLGPLNFHDTKMMIRFRLKKSSGAAKAINPFTYPALLAIYRDTAGYPRKIINLCHRCILAMIIQNRIRAGWFLVRSCAGRSLPGPHKRWSLATALVIIGLIAMTVIAGLMPDKLMILTKWRPEKLKTANIRNTLPVLNVREVPKQPDQEKDQSVVVNPIQKASNKNTPVIESPPPVLGSVALRRKETLWKLIENVYGVVDPHVINSQYIKSVTNANSHIKDPDHIEVARLITMPAIPVKVKPLQLNVWWVKIAEEDSLEKAISLLRSYPDNALPIRLIPYWTSQSGLKFAVLLKGIFFDEASARSMLANLPHSVALNGNILSEWDKDTIFYADPYTGVRSYKR